MTDFKTRCDELLNSYHRREIRKNNITSTISSEFDITPHTFRRRFKSIYGKTLTDACEDLLIPSREHVALCMMKSEDVAELWSILDIPSYYKKRVFMDNFGVSTFARAKAKVILESSIVEYDPSIDENKSLVISQVLGDGCYCSTRGALRISHGEKQFEYAVHKAALFNKAFPETTPSGSTKLLTHSQGHKYSSWYSKRLPSKITSWLEETSKADMVDELTPRGFMLWAMDDGSRSSDGVTFEMYIHDDDVATRTVKYLASYGITARLDKSGKILCIKDMVNSVKFYKNFIEPFKESLPECMAYKTNMKI